MSMLSIVEVLSQEILDYILDYFGSQHGGFDWEDWWWAALPTLKACSLVCKSFRHRSQYHIFTFIRLYDTGPRAITPKQRSTGLCELLSTRPQLARGPCHVTIAFHRRKLAMEDDLRDVDTMVSKEVAAILKSFVKAGALITTLSIAFPARDRSDYSGREKSDIQEGDEELGSCIDLSAIICLIVRATRLPISVISSLVNLKDLWVHNGSVRQHNETQERITLLKRPAIQHLKLTGSSIPSLEALFGVAHLLDLHNLQSLDVDPTGVFPARLISCLPNVQHLRLDHGLEAILPVPSKRFKFSSFKTLRTLYIEFDVDRTPFAEPPPLFFDHLCHCLISLPAGNLESVNLRFRVYPQLFFQSDLIRKYPWHAFWKALKYMIKRTGTCEFGVDFLERFWLVDGVDAKHKAPIPSPAVDVFVRDQSKKFKLATWAANSVYSLTHTLQVGIDEVITYSI